MNAHREVPIRIVSRLVRISGQILRILIPRRLLQIWIHTDIFGLPSENDNDREGSRFAGEPDIPLQCTRGDL